MEPANAPSAGVVGGRMDEFESLQARTLICFTVLHSAESSLRGSLTLCLGSNLHSNAASLAVLALGGTCLLLDEDRDRLREASRVGAVDFVVQGLSEALRILKNEIRKGTAVGVGLAAPPDRALAEMLHRGVQPDQILADAAGGESIASFLSKGAKLVCLPPVLVTAASGWKMRCDTADSIVERRERDAKMLRGTEAVAENDPGLAGLHTRWLQVAAALFPRDRDRFFWSAE